MKTRSHWDTPLLTDQEINALLGCESRKMPQSARPSAHRQGSTGLPTDRKGHSLEFDDLRHYHTGDDPKYIDWRASARSGQTLVRTYLAENQQPVFIVIDRSSSMWFGTHRRLKIAQAIRLGLWIGRTALNGQREVGGLLLDNDMAWSTPSLRLDALRDFARIACQPKPPTETIDLNWAQIFTALQHRLAKGSRLIVISDFHSLGDSERQSLKSIGTYFETQAVQIYDPFEREVDRITQFRLRWNHSEVILDTPTVAKKMAQQIEDHQRALAECFAAAHIPYTDIQTDLDDFDQHRGIHLA